MKVAITTSSFGQFSDEPLRLLADRNIEVIMNPYGRALSEGEATVLLQGCIAVAAGTEPLTAQVFDALPDLKIVSRCGTGMDSVDLEAARARGILVRNTPDAPTRAVAELVLGYALDLMRSISVSDRDIRNGNWKKRMGFLLQGKKLGVVGFGRIGRAVGELFRQMGCPVAFYDPMVLGVNGFDALPLDELLAWADIVTLHCPRQANGKPVLDDADIKLMKQGAWLINAARGGLVDEASLYAALNTGFLAGAALDTYVQEPYAGPLLEQPNIILTPHIGSYARESRITMELETIRNLLEALELQAEA